MSNPIDCRRKSRLMLTCLLLLASLMFISVPIMFLQAARASERLGVRNGRLAPCPGTPNCVSSTAGAPQHRLRPLSFCGDQPSTVSRLREVLHRMPGVRLVSVTDQYIHAQFRTPVFRFVDDAEFLLDPATARIHVRSAARIGYSDFGLNRRRIESIRGNLQHQRPRERFVDTSPHGAGIQTQNLRHITQR